MSIKPFHVGVKAVIIQKDKILLLRKVTDQPFWEFPGGRIDGTETVAETLLRELDEELPNIQDIQIGEILSAQRIERELKTDLGLFLVFYKVMAAFSGEPTISKEHSEYKWATKDEALELVTDASIDAIKRVI